MVDQLGSFASEVTRVAKEVGTDGKLGGQADVRGVAGTWKDLTDNVNAMAGNLTQPGAQHRRRDDRGREGRPVEEGHRRRQGRNSRAEEHRQHDGGPAVSSFASEVTRVAKEVGTEGQLGGQADVRGVAGTWKDLTDNVNELAGEPDRAAARRVEGRDRDRQRRPQSEDHRAGARRNSADQERHQHDGGPAERVRVGSDARREGSRHRRQAGRPGRSAAASPARGKTSPTTSTRWPAT